MRVTYGFVRILFKRHSSTYALNKLRTIVFIVLFYFIGLAYVSYDHIIFLRCTWYCRFSIT